MASLSRPAFKKSEDNMGVSKASPFRLPKELALKK